MARGGVAAPATRFLRASDEESRLLTMVLLSASKDYTMLPETTNTSLWILDYLCVCLRSTYLVIVRVRTRSVLRNCEHALRSYVMRVMNAIYIIDNRAKPVTLVVLVFKAYHLCSCIRIYLGKIMGKKAQERKVVVVQPRKAVTLQSSQSPSTGRKPVVISELLIEQPREGRLPPFSDAILQPRPPAELPISIPQPQEKNDEQTDVERGEKPEAVESGQSTPCVCCAYGDIANPRRWGYRNIFGLSIAFVTVFCAFIGLQNLQSSVNAEGGLGLASLSVLYAVFVLSGFVTPGIVRLLGTKFSLLFGFVCHLIYSLTNYHPTWYTLIPGSLAIGFASAPIWVAATTHITEVAVTIAPALKKKQDQLISMFIGIFYFFFQFSQIPGNLASSLILFPYDLQDNQLSSSDFSTETAYLNETAPSSDGSCDVLESTSIDRNLYIILVSVYVFFVVTGIIILLLTVDRLPTDSKFFSTERKFDLYLKKPFLELLKVLKDVRMIMIAPMAIFSGLEMSFAVGSFTETYISECFGTYQVGFTLLCLGVTSAVMSYIYGNLVKYIPRYSIVIFGACINVVLILFLFLWERRPSYPVIFIFAVGWGAAEAVWHTMSAML